MPLLFSKVRLRVGEPIALPPVLTPEEIDMWRQQLQERLDELDVELDS
jgi:hypothetical protein